MSEYTFVFFLEKYLVFNFSNIVTHANEQMHYSETGKNKL